jgi:dihydrofolate synthase / folylpolyglutamate synthase
MDRATEITKHLFSLHARGIKYDLDRMKRAVARIGNPEYSSPCFHVAGTNGKGSVCAFLNAMLRQSGIKTGLYTSPHLVRFEERFIINGSPVETSEWVAVYDCLKDIIDELHLTFFEATTLLAFELFKRRQVEWAIYETGLGGRLDATNVVMPRVSIITALAIDHRELLGNDLFSIAGEKLGIVKHRTPLVMARPDDPLIKDLARIHAIKSETSAVFVGMDEVIDVRGEPDGFSFDWKGNRYRIQAFGEYQIRNALLALNGLYAAGFTQCTSMGQGLVRPQLPGRFQVIRSKDKIVVFDVGHNAQAVRSFCAALRQFFTGKKICFIVGIMKDKDIGSMMPEYGPIASRILLTAPEIDRAASPETLRNALPETYGDIAACIPSVNSALDAALSGEEEVICVSGSFYTIGEAMQWLHVEPYPQSNNL